MTDKYNGWNNYETWCANLWLTNDAGSDSYWRSVADEIWDKGWDSSLDACNALAEQLESDFDEQNPLADGCSLYCDLLNTAIREIDWHEIANSLMVDDCDGYVDLYA